VKNIELVRQRANGHCEAMVYIEGSDAWTRCGLGPVEVHHALTKARGGRILDSINETYHLIALCPRCHECADGGDAYKGDVLIDGYITTENGQIVYDGSDQYLSAKYPRRAS
jgi:hypothetical protein